MYFATALRVLTEEVGESISMVGTGILLFIAIIASIKDIFQVFNHSTHSGQSDVHRRSPRCFETVYLVNNYLELAKDSLYLGYPIMVLSMSNVFFRPLYAICALLTCYVSTIPSMSSADFKNRYAIC